MDLSYALSVLRVGAELTEACLETELRFDRAVIYLHSLHYPAVCYNAIAIRAVVFFKRRISCST